MWLHFVLMTYILILGLLLGTSTSKNKKARNQVIIWLTFSVFIIIASFRSKDIGNDTANYLNLFKDISISSDLSYFTPRFEIGYVYLNKIVSYFTSHPQIILIVTSLIIMIGFARFIYKYSMIPWLSVYLFFTLGHFGSTLNTIRLNIAIVIILIAYDFLKKRKLLSFIITVFFAFLFHRTAIIFLMAWPLSKLRFNRKNLTILTIGSILVYFIFPVTMGIVLKIFPVYEYYLDSQYLDGEIRLASILNMLVGMSIILLGYFTKYHHSNHELDLEYLENNNKERMSSDDGKQMTLLLIVGTLLTFISFNFNLLGRVGDYFLVFSIVYIPNAIMQVKDKKLKVVLIYIIVVLFFMYSSTIQVFRSEWNIIYPYDFFWMIE